MHGEERTICAHVGGRRRRHHGSGRAAPTPGRRPTKRRRAAGPPARGPAAAVTMRSPPWRRPAAPAAACPRRWRTPTPHLRRHVTSVAATHLQPTLQLARTGGSLSPRRRFALCGLSSSKSCVLSEGRAWRGLHRYRVGSVAHRSSSSMVLGAAGCTEKTKKSALAPCRARAQTQAAKAFARRACLFRIIISYSWASLWRRWFAWARGDTQHRRKGRR